MTTPIIAESGENSPGGNSHQTVLVTGGTGYIGSWAIVNLLKQGYKVRTTMRTLERESKLRTAIASQVEPGERLSVVAADLLQDPGWDKAVEGVDYVLHIAAAMGVREYKDIDLIPPSREGTLRVLEASVRAGVKRVVTTSSGVAALPLAGNVREQSPASKPIDETSWTDPTAKGVDNYSQAKTLAEQAAWQFIREKGGATTLTTVLPVMVLGPVLGQEFAQGSVQVVAQLMSGRLPAIPRVGFSVVDVRDVVDLQIKAMTAPEAAGQRLIASADFLWLSDIAAILRQHLKDYNAKIPTRQMPDILLKLSGLFNDQARQLAPRVGKKQVFSSAKAKNLLGWQVRPKEETIIASAQSLIKAGLL